ncbi:hypothetical protein [Oceanibium sediminis]|nr:hypothetical protein [Oceanibium sediminis]
MGRLLKYLIYLLILAGIGLSGYALIFDLPAPVEPRVIPLEPPTG